MGLFDDGRTRAFKAQLKALDAPRYRVTVQTPDDRVQVAVLPAGDLLRQERWLRGQNEVGVEAHLAPPDAKERVQTAKERRAEANRLRAYAGRARGEADGSAARGIAQMRQRLGMI